MNHTASIRRNLLRWYDRSARPLPWRQTKDPYTVWVSEIILQQTRVDQGTPYFVRFLRAFPDLAALARAPEDGVLKQWEGLGYYTRARNLHRAARQIMDQGGRLPRTADEWQKLPGVGRYTANAIASIAYGERVPVLDGNVIRVLARVFNVAACVDNARTRAKLWDLATGLVPRNRPGDFNQAMMELGARICVPRQPVCQDCPIRRQCAACAAGTQEKRPVRKPKKATPHYEIVVGAVRKRGRYLVGKRPPGGLLGGLWEFPGGKARAGETHQAALTRELREETGIDVRVGGRVAVVRHAYSHFRVTLTVYRCDLLDGKPEARVHTELRWLSPEDFGKYPFPKANHKFLHLLE